MDVGIYKIVSYGPNFTLEEQREKTMFSCCGAKLVSSYGRVLLDSKCPNCVYGQHEQSSMITIFR